MRRTTRVLLVAAALAAVWGGYTLAAAVRRGFSARDEPSGAEEVVARAFRRWATPEAIRRVPNPVAASPEVLTRARRHFADHCAGCHGNDGSGRTPIGQRLYPRAPDMRGGETQRLTDGELFSIIRNGIRLTGMPAWGDGTPKEDVGTWELVHFIRHLPGLTPSELAEMEALNPKSPAEFEKARQIEAFLAGSGSTALSSPERRMK
ncbi:MAG TPA: cytochrome c [Thermoanaerobaculia bacterium]|nr:cytochrome c [Thermoanaerobaculia bacterium]HPA51437.1 cytochrome c [Thermoanaerobaculia bacterium]HQN08007.1 cytochrome c [Thermoanaerobaculia bacterium]HQP87848.1 cytochrome c [Thermoanaerobaculia bacterium]